MAGAYFWLGELCPQESCRLYPILKHHQSTVIHDSMGKNWNECRVDLPDLDCSSTQEQQWCQQKNMDNVSQEGCCSGAQSVVSKLVPHPGHCSGPVCEEWREHEPWGELQGWRKLTWMTIEHWQELQAWRELEDWWYLQNLKHQQGHEAWGECEPLE